MADKTDIAKARELTDVSVQFVSLVDKAANQHTFMIQKAQEAGCNISHCTPILKADSKKDADGKELHYVTGVVYEPMKVDSQGDYMTAETIAKAAHDFMKNGRGVDLQHNFQKMDTAAAVETWVTKADEVVGGKSVPGGTWLMTVETGDEAVWDKIQKGEITGFSIGGKAARSTTDVPASEVHKSDEPLTQGGLFAALRKFFGVEEPVEKAGRKMSGKNRKALKSLQDDIAALSERVGQFASTFDAPEGGSEGGDVAKSATQEVEMTKDEMAEVMDSFAKTFTKSLGEFGETITKAVSKPDESEKPKAAASEKPKKDDDQPKEPCQKSADGEPEAPITKADVQEMIEKALEPVLKSTGQATNLNNEIKKSDTSGKVSWADVLGI